MSKHFRNKSKQLLAAVFFIVYAHHDLYALPLLAQNFSRGEILQSVLFFILGVALIIFIFYFLLFKFLLSKNYRAQAASNLVLSLTALYGLAWLTMMFFKFNLLPGWQWIGIFIFLGVVWLLHFVFTVAMKR
jgi:hypothetical protein